MEKNIKAYTLSSLLFLCILSLSSALSGVFSVLTRIFSFLLPALLAYLISDGKKAKKLPLGGVKKSLSLALFFPIALLIIFLLSMLTTLILNSAGASSPNPLSGNVNFDLLYLGFLPAFTEELLFRFIPIIIIAPYSKKTAIAVSALFFAAAHASLFSIPYALAAGIIFMTLDLMADSVWPSVALHLINNFLSVFYMYFAFSEGFTYLFFGILGLLSSMCIGIIILLREHYINMLKDAFSKDDRVKIPYFTAAFILPTLALAVLNLF